MKHRGVICDKCGVEVTRSRVRRERMGHIELASPVSHVWFFKGLPSRIGHLLDISLRDLERILYFESYVVIDPGDTELKEKELLTEERYRELRDQYGDGAFDARMGAEAIKELLSRIDVDELAEELRIVMRTETSQIRRLKAAKRLKVVDAFRRSGHRPEWMILDVIPVIPPELRPLVPLDGGRFATSRPERSLPPRHQPQQPVEEAARAARARRHRAQREAHAAGGGRRAVRQRPPRPRAQGLEQPAAEVAVRHAQGQAGPLPPEPARQARRLLGPFGDRRRSRAASSHQCGLPKKMALELFKPFIYNRLEEKGLVGTIKAAKEMVEREEDVVWDALEEVIQDHPVLLNRAPTLHRLGIQAFQPVLIEGKAIKIHPLVCAAFNADFDGDQMAVHVPLSPKAQIESQVLMLASNNILSPAHGRPLAVPSQDLVLGGYYLTMAQAGRARARARIFPDFDAVLLALHEGEVETQTRRSRCATPGRTSTSRRSTTTQDVVHAEVETARPPADRDHGRPRDLQHGTCRAEIPFINGLLKKRGLQDLVGYCFIKLRQRADGADARRAQGDHLPVRHPGRHLVRRRRHGDSADARPAILDQARTEVVEIENQRSAGVITARRAPQQDHRHLAPRRPSGSRKRCSAR